MRLLPEGRLRMRLLPEGRLGMRLLPEGRLRIRLLPWWLLRERLLPEDVLRDPALLRRLLRSRPLSSLQLPLSDLEMRRLLPRVLPCGPDDLDLPSLSEPDPLRAPLALDVPSEGRLFELRFLGVLLSSELLTTRLTVRFSTRLFSALLLTWGWPGTLASLYHDVLASALDLR